MGKVLARFFIAIGIEELFVNLEGLFVVALFGQLLGLGALFGGILLRMAKRQEQSGECECEADELSCFHDSWVTEVSSVSPSKCESLEGFPRFLINEGI